MKILILACFFVVGVRSDAAVINAAVDAILDSAKEVLKSRGQDKLVVPNLDKGFDIKIFGAPIHGEFHASGGLFKDTTSLHRTGDVTMETHGNELVLSASLGMSVLEVDFSHYMFNLLAIHSEGSIHAACTKNSITAVISVVREEKSCKMNLQKASIDSLGGFDVQMTGPGDINKLGNLLINWILNHFNDLIRGQINLHLEDALRQALQKANVCDKIPF